MTAIQSTVTSRTRGQWSPTSKTKDAIGLLTEDHARIKEMFREFDELHEKNDAEENEELMGEICRELILHMQLEEEIFYPAAREAIRDDLVNEAMMERASIKGLIRRIQSLDASDPMNDALADELNGCICRHAERQETKVFPKVRDSKIDLAEVGSDMAVCKGILMEDWI